MNKMSTIVHTREGVTFFLSVHGTWTRAEGMQAIKILLCSPKPEISHVTFSDKN